MAKVVDKLAPLVSALERDDADLLRSLAVWSQLLNKAAQGRESVRRWLVTRLDQLADALDEAADRLKESAPKQEKANGGIG